MSDQWPEFTTPVRSGQSRRSAASAVHQRRSSIVLPITNRPSNRRSPGPSQAEGALFQPWQQTGTN